MPMSRSSRTEKHQLATGRHWRPLRRGKGGVLPRFTGTTLLRPAPTGALDCTACGGQDRRGPSCAVSYSPGAPQAALNGTLVSRGEMLVAERKQVSLTCGVSQSASMRQGVQLRATGMVLRRSQSFRPRIARMLRAWHGRSCEPPSSPSSAPAGRDQHGRRATPRPLARCALRTVHR